MLAFLFFAGIFLLIAALYILVPPFLGRLLSPRGMRGSERLSNWQNYNPMKYYMILAQVMGACW